MRQIAKLLRVKLNQKKSRDLIPPYFYPAYLCWFLGKVFLFPLTFHRGEDIVNHASLDFLEKAYLFRKYIIG